MFHFFFFAFFVLILAVCLTIATAVHRLRNRQDCVAIM